MNRGGGKVGVNIQAFIIFLLGRNIDLYMAIGDHDKYLSTIFRNFLPNKVYVWCHIYHQKLSQNLKLIEIPMG